MPVKKDSIPKDTQKKPKTRSATAQQRNLVNLADRPKEERTAIARKGAYAAVEVKKEKKLVSQILADYLQKEHEVILRDDQGEVIDRETIPASELIERTVTAVMARGDSASVAMIKTISESTEGQKMQLSGLLETASLTPDERRKRIAELEKKRSGMC